MYDDVQAILKPLTGTARETGRPYNYVSVQVDGVEVGRLFLQPLLWSVLFEGKTFGRG